ncbi:MAG TPA: hypothetical protein VJK48_05405, partial [Chlamydiales bacterium]|nr:hypothetical protein [Chlamydiales bacterium]
MFERPLFRKPYFILSVSTLSLIFLHQDLSAQNTWTSNGDAGYSGTGLNGSLVYCIWNAQSGDTINMGSGVSPQQPLPAFIQPNVTLNGNGYTLNGYSSFTGNTPLFSVATTGITIQDVKIENGYMQGGDGGDGAAETGNGYAYGGGGGGGAAGGGGLFLAPNSSVTLTAPLGITYCQATGGNGGGGATYYNPYADQDQLWVLTASGGGGGGGHGGGDGGSASTFQSGAGGGGHPGGGNNNSSVQSHTYSGAGGSGSGNSGPGGSSSYSGGSSSFCSNTGTGANTAAYGGGGGGGTAGPGGDGSCGIAEGKGGNGGAGFSGFGNFGGGGGGGAGQQNASDGLDTSVGSGSGAGGGAGSCASNAATPVVGNGGLYGGGGGGGMAQIGQYYNEPNVSVPAGSGNGGGGAGGYDSTSSTTPMWGGAGGSAYGGGIYLSPYSTLTVNGANEISVSGNSVTGGSGGTTSGGSQAPFGVAIGPNIAMDQGSILNINFDPGVQWSLTGLDFVTTNDVTINLQGGELFLEIDQLPDNITLASETALILTFLNEEDVTVNAANISNGGNLTLIPPANITVAITGPISGSTGIIETGINGSTPGELAIDSAISGNIYYNVITTVVYDSITVNSYSNYSLSTASGAPLGSTTGVPTGGLITATTYTNFANTETNVYGGSIATTDFYNYGIINGCGTISGTVTNYPGSYVQTGCSPTPLIIAGNLISNPNTTISPILEDDGLATIIVSGSVTLDDGVSLVIRPEAGCYRPASTYPVITAGGTFTGTFSSVEIGTHFLTADLEYGSQGVAITVQRVPLKDLITGENIGEVASALDALAASGYSIPCEATKKLFYSSLSEIQTALESMDPALFKALTLSQENNIVKVRETFSYR